MLRPRYYEDDQEVESDNELQELVNELSANGTGDFGGMGMVRHFTKQSYLLWQKCIQLSAFLAYSIQLFRERLFEKVHRTILRYFVKEIEKMAHGQCLRVLKEITKSRFDSYAYSDWNSVLIISHITFRDCRVHISFPTTFLEIAVDISIKPSYIADRVLQLQCDHR